MPRGPLGEPGEMRPRILIERRHAHQPDQRRAEPRLAIVDERHRPRRAPRLTSAARRRCSPRSAASACGLPSAAAAAIASASRGRSSVSITSASRTASRALLVCRPPMMCRLNRCSGAQRRELRRRLLHAVLAEHRLAGRQRRAHRLDRLGLRHRDQRHILRLAARLDRRVGDAVAHPAQIVGDRRASGGAMTSAMRRASLLTVEALDTGILLLLDDSGPSSSLIARLMRLRSSLVR